MLITVNNPTYLLWVFRILRGQAPFVPFLKKGNTKNFWCFERCAFKVNKVKER